MSPQQSHFLFSCVRNRRLVPIFKSIKHLSHHEAAKLAARELVIILGVVQVIAVY